MIGDGSHPTLPCPRPTTTISAYSLMHLNGPECRNVVLASVRDERGLGGRLPGDCF